MIIAVVKELKQLQRKPRKKSEASTGFSTTAIRICLSVGLCAV